MTHPLDHDELVVADRMHLTYLALVDEGTLGDEELLGGADMDIVELVP